MTPEISEFSFGFALTNEIVGWTPLAAAPLFPSLIEEGKAGGGNDVKLDMPGVPLYLQFKRAACMFRCSAKEIRDHKLPLVPPFYRFKITEARKSDQHELLLALDDGSAHVYYAAPRFHRIAEINVAWSANAVASRSIFVAPRRIGTLDDQSHHVAYDDAQAWLCSEPQKLDSLTSGNLVGTLQHALQADARSLRKKLPELIEQVHAAERRAETRAAERRRRADDQLPGIAVESGVEPPAALPTSPVPVRAGRSLSDDEVRLRELADTAARIFSTQLIIAQPKSGDGA